MNPPERTPAAGMTWRYAPAREYESPRPPSTEKVSSGLRAVGSRIWGRKRPTPIVVERAELTPLQGSVLAEISPESPWSSSTEGLATLLDPWQGESNHRNPSRGVVIGPPGSGVREVLARWGERNSAEQVAPPPRESLLDSGPEWWRDIDPDQGGLLVIPELERFYLRHHDGLALVRALMGWLWDSPRRVVAGCDSWAWAYLRRAARIDAVFEAPVALMPLDGPALRAWFRPRPRGRYLVRSTRNGEVLYPCEDGVAAGEAPQPGSEDDEMKNAPGADVFQRIAATSRGIPEVALALWRQGLCEDDAARPDAPGPTGPIAIRARTPQELHLPTLPAETSIREAVVLHTLLLHRALPVTILFRLVPFAASVVLGILSTLHDDGLIEEVESLWRVTQLGYPAVRAYLAAEGFLVDTF